MGSQTNLQDIEKSNFMTQKEIVSYALINKKKRLHKNTLEVNGYSVGHLRTVVSKLNKDLKGKGRIYLDQQGYYYYKPLPKLEYEPKELPKRYKFVDVIPEHWIGGMDHLLGHVIELDGFEPFNSYFDAKKEPLYSYLCKKFPKKKNYYIFRESDFEEVKESSIEKTIVKSTLENLRDENKILKEENETLKVFNQEFADHQNRLLDENVKFQDEIKSLKKRLDLAYQDQKDMQEGFEEKIEKAVKEHKEIISKLTYGKYFLEKEIESLKGNITEDKPLTMSGEAVMITTKSYQEFAEKKMFELSNEVRTLKDTNKDLLEQIEIEKQVAKNFEEQANRSFKYCRELKNEINSTEYVSKLHDKLNEADGLNEELKIRLNEAEVKMKEMSDELEGKHLKLVCEEAVNSSNIHTIENQEREIRKSDTAFWIMFAIFVVESIVLTWGVVQ